MSEAMHITAQQEEFSRAYVQAVATVAGFPSYKPSVDDDSIDIVFAKKGGNGTVRSPRLEAQLKSLRVSELPIQDIKYQLKPKKITMNCGLIIRIYHVY